MNVIENNNNVCLFHAYNSYAAAISPNWLTIDTLLYQSSVTTVSYHNVLFCYWNTQTLHNCLATFIHAYLSGSFD